MCHLFWPLEGSDEVAGSLRQKVFVSGSNKECNPPLLLGPLCVFSVCCVCACVCVLRVITAALVHKVVLTANTSPVLHWLYSVCDVPSSLHQTQSKYQSSHMRNIPWWRSNSTTELALTCRTGGWVPCGCTHTVSSTVYTKCRDSPTVYSKSDYRVRSGADVCAIQNIRL